MTENVKIRSLRDTVSSVSIKPTMPSMYYNFVDSTATDMSNNTFPSASLCPSPVWIPRPGRATKQPDRYGEWISNQITAGDIPRECQI